MTGWNVEDWTRRLVEAAVAEDVGDGDWTSVWTIPGGETSRAVIVAKQRLVVAGMDMLDRVFRHVDPSVAVERALGDGDTAEPEQALARVSGSARSILTAERPALNFLGRLSGVATLTARFVEAVAGTRARVIDTRKTTPGWRALEKAAVRSGGGSNHRMGLYDMVLVKDNHADVAGGVEHAVRAVRERNSRGLEVEVEVRSLEELDRVLDLGVERVLLDNMDPDTLRAAVERARRLGGQRPWLEASGNVSLDTVRRVAETGVDFVSVGALTHSAPAADVSLRVVA